MAKEEKYFNIYKYMNKSELKFSNVIKVSNKYENIRDIRTIDEFWNIMPHYMLKSIMSSNPESRVLPSIDLKTIRKNTIRSQIFINPMDVFIYIFLMSEPLLRQIIVHQVSKCQLSLPLVIKDIRFPIPIIFTFAYQNLIKSYFKSEGTVKSFHVSDEKLNIISFIRIGKCPNSFKSKLINEILEFKHHSFFTKDSKCSCANRLLHDGTIEMCWYLPGNLTNTKFKDPLTFLNLRGNAFEHAEQTKFIFEVSTMVAVILTCNEIVENEKEELDKIARHYHDKLCLIFTDGTQFEDDICKFVNALEKFNQNDKNTLFEDNLNLLVIEVYNSINEILTNSHTSKKISLMDCINLIKKDHINFMIEDEQINEKFKNFQSKIKCFRENVLCKTSSDSFYQDYLPLQALGWKQYAHVEKNIIQMHNKGDVVSDSKIWCEIKLELTAARNLQLKSLAQSHIALRYCKNLLSPTCDAKHALYMFILLRIELEKKSTSCTESITVSVQNIIRELGQFYEINCHCAFNSNLAALCQDINLDYKNLPTLFAKLLLFGHPFEILDGEVQHIPLTWVQAVLKALSKEIGRDKRIFVLGVLGIQSSGKSTLLNTMFGIQFPVASGRCTRGVSMQIIAVDEEYAYTLNYDYLVILDSEGLRSIEDNNEDMTRHDNELATFIVGISDLTIVNIKGENFTEWQDIFQIIIIALMKLTSCYSKPKCLFVHQNVDPSAAEKLQVSYKIFLSKLDNATKLISSETKSGQLYTKFTDIIDFDIENSIYHFPSLHSKPPPMSIISENYVIATDKLKNDILYMHYSKPLILHLQEWNTKISTVWKAIQKENFIFNYKNNIERIYYDELENALHQWSQNYSCEMEKFFLLIKDQILNEDKEKIEIENRKTILEYESQLREKCLSILQSDEAEFKVYYFSKHREYKILSQWKTHADIHFNNIRTDHERRLLNKLQGILETAKENQPLLNDFIEKRKVILERAKKAKFEHMFQSVKQQDQEFLEEFFEDEWQSWIKGIRLTEQESPCINLLLLLKKEIEQLTSEMNASDEEIAIIKSFFQRFKDNDTLPDTFFIGTKHYKIINQQGNEVKHTRQFSCWIDSVNKKRNSYVNSSKLENNLFLKVSVLHKKISKQCKDYIQQIKNHEFSVTFYKFIIMTIIGVVKEFNQKEDISKSRVQIENMFVYEICLFFCTNIITKIKETRISNLMDSLKIQLKSIFMNFYHEENFSPSMACANGLATIILEKMYTYFADTLQFILIYKFIDTTDCLRLSKCQLQYKILSNLANVYSFVRYIDYIQSPNNAIKDWIVEQYKEFCKSELSISFAVNWMEEKIRLHFEVYTEALRMSLNSHRETDESSENCNINPNWKFELHKYLDGDYTRQFKLTDLDTLIIEPYEIRNPDEFVSFFIESLQKQNEMINFHAWILKYLASEVPSDNICKNLSYCNELCPLCKEPCLSTVNSPGHKHHCGSFHRPLGLNGWYKNNSGEFVANDCTNLAPKVKCNLVNNKLIYEKCIKDYEGWEDSDKYHMIESVYWEWVMCQFKDEFANHYGYKINKKAIDAWANLTQSEILNSLQRQMNDFHNPSFIWRTKKKIIKLFSKVSF